MRQSRLLLTLILLGACLKYDATAKLPIEGSQSQAQKEQLARSVAEQISRAEVRSQVQRAFGLNSEQAASLFAGPQTFTISAISGTDRRPSTTVSVIVGIRDGGSLKKAETVAKFYQELARAELRRQVAAMAHAGAAN